MHHRRENGRELPVDRDAKQGRKARRLGMMTTGAIVRCSMGVSTDHLSFQSALDVAASESGAYLDRQLAEAPIDTEQIRENTLLLVGRRPGALAKLTAGMAEAARCIRSDWAWAWEDLRKAVARRATN